MTIKRLKRACAGVDPTRQFRLSYHRDGGVWVAEFIAGDVAEAETAHEAMLDFLMLTAAAPFMADA